MSDETRASTDSRSSLNPFLTANGNSFSKHLEQLLLKEGVYRRTYASGEKIFDEGGGGDCAYFVHKGSIDILSRGRDGRERVLNHVRTGELFGEMALLDQEKRSASAVAAEATELMVIPRDEVASLLERVPELSQWMLKLLSHRLRVLTRMVKQMEEVQEVNLKILAGQDEERRRIGRDIHDGVAQSFVDFILRVQIADRLLDQDADKVRFELDSLEDGLRDVLHRVRELVYDLYPKELGRVGLVGAIERFVERIAASNGLRVSFETYGPRVKLPPTLESALYCIVQEALNNVRKHAGAEHARLELRYEASQLSMLIADDGHGFDVDAVVKDDAWRQSYGLISMEERAKLAGGRMELDSRPGHGTRLRFTFPVSECEVVG